MNVLALALAADWPALRADDGWERVVDRSIDIGDVAVDRREVDGMWCLRATATTSASPDRLMAVLWDVAGAPTWSSNPLAVSEVLVAGEDRLVFWQHLDLPGWTLASDRYWVLEATARREADGARAFLWERVDAATAWPQVIARASALDAAAMQPPVMWGEWRFSADGTGARVVWRGCQDIGGRVPRWLQTWAGARALPDAVADLVHAAEGG